MHNLVTMNTQASSSGNTRLVESQAVILANAVKAWWEEHKYDTTGEYGDRNVFDVEPDFVRVAKTVIGDWEADATASELTALRG